MTAIFNQSLATILQGEVEKQELEVELDLDLSKSFGTFSTQIIEGVGRTVISFYAPIPKYFIQVFKQHFIVHQIRLNLYISFSYIFWYGSLS